MRVLEKGHRLGVAWYLRRDEPRNHDGTEAARILAMTLAQYQARSDELPADEYVSLATLDRLTQKLAQILADLMALLVGVLRTLAGHAEPDSPTH